MDVSQTKQTAHFMYFSEICMGNGDVQISCIVYFKPVF